MDLALEYIVGGSDQNSGLKFLEEIVLPKKSFVTENGLQVCDTLSSNLTWMKMHTKDVTNIFFFYLLSFYTPHMLSMTKCLSLSVNGLTSFMDVTKLLITELFWLEILTPH